MKPEPNKQAYWRYIPHYDYPNMLQNICFRLADSLPRHVAENLQEKAEAEGNVHLRTEMEAVLNSGYGACWLRNPQVAKIVEDSLKYFDGERYELNAWVIMPNHVHILMRIFKGFPMPKVIDSWKTWTARNANKVLGRSGKFWSRGFFDRYIRNQDHYVRSIRYIHANPVMAGLVDRPQDWRFSSIERFLED